MDFQVIFISFTALIRPDFYNSTNGVGNKAYHSAHPQLLHLPQGQELQDAQEDSHNRD